MKGIEHYLGPIHFNVDQPLTNTCAIVGKPGTGKTTTVNAIQYRINQVHKDLNPIFIKTNDLSKIRNIPEDEELLKACQDSQLITIFGDDITRMHNSKDTISKRLKEFEKDFNEIRHEIRKYIGEGARTVNLIFASQRYYSTQNILRECEVLVFKPIDMRDNHHIKTVIDLMGRGAFNDLRWLNNQLIRLRNPVKEVSFGGVSAPIISWCLVRPGSSHYFRQTIKKEAEQFSYQLPEIIEEDTGEWKDYIIKIPREVRIKEASIQYAKGNYSVTNIIKLLHLSNNDSKTITRMAFPDQPSSSQPILNYDI